MKKILLSVSLLLIASTSYAQSPYPNPSKEDCSAIVEPYENYELTKACLSKAFPKFDIAKEFTVGYLYRSAYPCDVLHVISDFENLKGERMVVAEYVSSCGQNKGRTWNFKKVIYGQGPWQNIGPSPFVTKHFLPTAQ